MAGVGMHGRGRHAWQGGMGCRGHGYQGAYMAGVCVARTHSKQILRDTVNERVVCILLECILVVVCKEGML